MTACQEEKQLYIAHRAFQLVPYLLRGLARIWGFVQAASAPRQQLGPAPVYADTLREIILSTAETEAEAGLVETVTFRGTPPV